MTPDIDWPKLLAEAGLPENLEPLPWQRRLIRDYAARRPLVVPSGRRAGRKTVLGLLRAYDRLYGYR